MKAYIFGISSYSIMLVLGLVAALLVFRLLSTTYKLSDKAFLRLGYIIIISIAAGFVFAYLFQRFYVFLYNIANPDDKMAGGGITFLGGLVGGALTFLIISLFAVKGETKKEIWTVVCIAPPAISIAHALGRIGCFLAGCCYGKETNSFIGVLFPYEDHKRIPTQLIEAIFLAILFIALLILILKFKRYSLTMPVYLFAYSVFRFILEFLRGDEARAVAFLFSPSQWLSILLFTVGIALTVHMFIYKRIPFNGKQDLSKKELTSFLVDKNN